MPHLTCRLPHAQYQLLAVDTGHTACHSTPTVPSRRLDELRDYADQLDMGKHTVLLCHHGVRSAQAAAILQKYHDFTTVSNVVGGIDRFSAEVDSGVPRY